MRLPRVFTPFLWLGAAVGLMVSIHTAFAQTVINVPAGGNLQQAIDSAQPGSTITLQPGATYRGNFKLRNKTGNAFITITTSAPETLPAEGARMTPQAAANLPKIVSPNNSAAIGTDAGAHHYRLVGLEVSGPPGVYPMDVIALGSSTATQVSSLASDIELDRLYVHGDPQAGGKRGITLNSRATVVKNCWISDFKSTSQDTQAIMGWNGPGPFEIINNHLEAAAENILFGGALPKINGLIPSDIVIKNNHFYKPLSWKRDHPSYSGTPWVVKNLFELKFARRVLIEGNVFENNWVQADQHSFAIVFSVRAEHGSMPWAVVEDVTFVRNIVRNSGAGVSILGKDYNSSMMGITRRVLIQDNLFYDLNKNVWGGKGAMLMVLQGAEDITVNHNTLIQQNGVNVVIFDGAPSPRTTFVNNIVPHGAYGVSGAGKGTGTPALDYYSPGYVFRKNVIPGGNASKYPSDNFFPPNLDAVGFVDLAGKDYHLAPGSAYKNAGTDRLDIGAAIDEVLAATEGAVEGQGPREQAPAAVSVTPSSGGDFNQVFRFVYSDGNGFADIATAEALINGGLSFANGCHLQVKPGQNRVWLRTDDNSAWLGPLTLGGAGGLSNGQCTVDAAASSLVGSGSILTANLSLAFASAFTGAKSIYMYAADAGGLNSNWQLRGTWAPDENRPPATVSMTPATGSGLVQTFRFLYSDPNGAEDLAVAAVYIDYPSGQGGACNAQYDAAQNTLWLRDDAGVGWLGPVAPGTAGALSNSRCGLDAAASAARRDGNTLALDLRLSFKAAFSGPKDVFLRAADKAGALSGWQKRGTWTVPGQAPTADSVTPASGRGSSQTFQFLYSDANGSADLSLVNALFNTSTAQARACLVQYRPADRSLRLRNDAGTGWIGPIAIGSGGTLRNTRCTVSGAGSSASLSGNSLALTLPVTFTRTFAGAKGTYLYAADKTGKNSGWKKRGTWTVP